MKRHLLTLFALTLSIGLIIAQTPDRKWAIGVKGGSQQYNGDIGNGFFNMNQAFYGFGGITINRNLSKHLDLNVGATSGSVGHFDNSFRRFSTRMTEYSARIKYNFFESGTHTLTPYVSTGLGYIQFRKHIIRNDNPYGNHHGSTKDFDNMILPSFGLGLNIKLSPTISVVLDENYIRSDYDAIDNHVNNAKDVYLQHSLGLVFNIAQGKDGDKDGVKDKVDECPNVFGLKSLNGCPDSDGDGIADKDDKCPNKKDPKNLNGCPDSDGDGVADKDDKCPNKKGLKNLKGCPDGDGDGVADKDDECPSVKGLKNLKGCPDSDGDGVADKDDECPSVKGSKKAKGCPEKSDDKIKTKLPKKSVYTILFESGNSSINKKSKAILKTVAQIANKAPKFKLEINGYTDADGDDKMNLALSKKRAEIVKKFLVSKGISAKRITTKGYGEKILLTVILLKVEK